MSANIKASTDGTQAIIGVGGVDQMTVSNAGVVTANSFAGLNNSSVTATGSTTARTLANRFADVGNVKDWGAVGDGIADDSDAIQNCIYYNKAIYFPEGNYRITKQISMNSLVSLFGDSSGAVIITLDNPSVGVAFLIKAGTGESYKNSLSDITIFNTASSTYQVGVRAERPASMEMTNVSIAGFATCLDVRGGINCTYTSVKLNAWTSTNLTSGSATLQISDSTDTGYKYGYTHLFVNSTINGNNYTEYAVKFTGNDYASFSNCYFNAGKTGCVLIRNDGTSTSGNYSNNFDNCYFDRVTGPGTNQIALNISDADPKTGNSVGTKITDCIFGGWDTAIFIDKEFDPSTEITGCRIWDSTKSAIDVTGAFTNLLITGNHFNNCTYNVSGSSAIDVKDAHSVTISGNVFSYLETKTFIGTRNAIKLAGTIDSASINGNTINTFPTANVTDFVNSATITRFTISGNSSDNSTSTILGTTVGNVENNDSFTLNWYQEGFFLPVLKFGGASTGITYSARDCFYTRIGNRVFFDIYVVLTSKGTATGVASVDGFPFNKNGSGIPVFNVKLFSFAPTVGDTNLEGSMPSSITEVRFHKYSGGSPVDLTDADFTNGSYFMISGNYFV